MGRDMQDSYRRDMDQRRSGGPAPRRDDWSGERRGPSGFRGSVPRGEDGRASGRMNSGSAGGPPNRGSGSGGLGRPGGGGGGGLLRPPLAGGGFDDDGGSGPRSGAGRTPGRGASRQDSGAGPASRAGRGSGEMSARSRTQRPDRGSDEFSRSGASGRIAGPRNGYSDERSGARPTRRPDEPGRSVGERFRDAGRSMSRQFAAMMEGAGRAGRAVRRELTAMSESMSAQSPALGGPMGQTDLVGIPYRRSRSRLLARKWRMRRVGRNPMGFALGFAALVLVVSALVGASGAGGAYAYSYYQTNRGAIRNAAIVGNARSTVIYDRNGTPLYAMQRKEGFQFNVPYNHINPAVITATIDTEDRTFWTNQGIDVWGTMRALYTDLTHGGSADQGASTITQQLVKLLVLENGQKTLDRKLHEAILSIGMTTSGEYTKAQILQMYLNNIYYDDQNSGIEAAARNYFGYQPITDANNNIVKEANEQLTLAQAAILVRIPNYPTKYYPLSFSCKTAPCPESQWNDNGNETNVLDGAITVLQNMETVGDLSPDQYTKTRAEVIQILVNQQIYHWKGLSAGTTASEVAIKKAPHFVDQVIAQLINEFGVPDEKALANMGLSVYTTLDYNLESYLEVDANKYINGDPNDPNHEFTRYWYCPNYYHNSCRVPALKDSDNVNNEAAVAVDPYTGDILAMMGSVDYASTDKKVLGFNNMAVLPRSMGSSVKPLIYSTAFQMGWYPGIMLQDIPVCYPGKQPPDSSGKYTPDPAAPACTGYYVAHDYDATSFSGTAPIRVMLANSLNIPATEAMYFVGASYNTYDRFLDFIGRMGVTTCIRCDSGAISAKRMGPTTALGTQEMPLYQLTEAYGTFATGGRHTPTRMILRIDDNNGNTLYTAPKPQLQQIMSPQVAYMITSILTDNTARAGDFKIENPLCFTCYPEGFVQGMPALNFGTPDNSTMYIASKTGTAQGLTGPEGIVTMGYSPYMALGVWAGNSDPHDDLNPNIIGITGAGYIFHDVMAWAIRNYKWPAKPFAIPSNLARAQFNCSTGLAPYKGTDMNAFTTAGPNTKGTGWCDLTYWNGPASKGTGSTNLYVGWNAGPYRQNVDWIIDGQLPGVS